MSCHDSRAWRVAIYSFFFCFTLFAKCLVTFMFQFFFLWKWKFFFPLTNFAKWWVWCKFNYFWTNKLGLKTNRKFNNFSCYRIIYLFSLFEQFLELINIFYNFFYKSFFFWLQNCLFKSFWKESCSCILFSFWTTRTGPFTTCYCKDLAINFSIAIKKR